MDCAVVGSGFCTLCAAGGAYAGWKYTEGFVLEVEALRRKVLDEEGEEDKSEAAAEAAPSTSSSISSSSEAERQRTSKHLLRPLGTAVGGLAGLTCASAWTINAMWFACHLDLRRVPSRGFF